jgi:predicted HAD superfamily Cof-like phosphohydrolase
MEHNMSRDWVRDINEMHTKYGVRDWVAKNPEKLREYLTFRLNFLQEELDETRAAGIMDENPEEVVDGLIDLCVVAIGTLDAFGIDAYKAWDEVHKANMTKEVGIKPERPNPLGLPDLMKPEGWKAPEHTGNHGGIPRRGTK